ncbi:MAG: CAAX prenyl protease-related protein [Chthoniobacteraceae bacterium]
MFGSSSEEKAYFAPLAVFLGITMVGQLVGGIFDGLAFWPVAYPQYWVHPAQTLVCGALVLRWWKYYGLRPPAHVVFTAFIGVVALILWVSPLAYLVESIHPKSARVPGFDPAFFGTGGWPYFLNVGCRFLRLVVVVPLVEEIFWRGFLLRWLIDVEFTKVPFGTFQWKSFAIVAVMFMLEHAPADWPAALLTGALFNLVAIRTRSLSSCVLVHAITNLLLGIYILRTGQTGFW